MKAIHQFVAGFSRGDAISNEAVVLRDVFRSWGYESQIFSESKRILPELRKEARDVDEYRASASAEDVVLLHLSIGSRVNDVFPKLPCRKAILYHNITPPEYLSVVQPQIASHLARGREQLQQLAGTAEVVMADSVFNAGELESLGYGKTSVLPLVLDLGRLREKVDRKTAKKYDDGLVNILFVGRCVPNKRIEDLLSAFYYFQHYIEPNSRLIHVGSFAGTERYRSLLVTFARELRVENVDFFGTAPQPVLNAIYQHSHVFLCMSEHEGFCIPLIESMVHDLPIVAYDAAAVPETLDGAGILFTEKRFDLVAEILQRVVTDDVLRTAVVEKQRARLKRYEERDPAKEIRRYLEPLLS